MSLIDALWNDPNAQTRGDLTLSGLSRIGGLSSFAYVAWKVSTPQDLQVGDAVEISGVTGDGAAALNGRFVLIYSIPYNGGTQFRYVVPPNTPDPNSGDVVTLTRLRYERVFIALRADGQLGSGAQEDP